MTIRDVARLERKAKLVAKARTALWQTIVEVDDPGDEHLMEALTSLKKWESFHASMGTRAKT